MAVAFRAKSEVFKTDGGKSLLMTAHADTEIGDLLIAYISKDDNNDIDETGSYGLWTMIYNNVGSGANCLYVAWKVAESGDASGSTEYTWNEASGNEDWIGIIITYSGAAEAPIHDSGIDTGDSGTPTAPSVGFTDLAAGSLVLQVMGIDQDDDDYVTPSQLTERFNAIQGNEIGGAGGDREASVGFWISPSGFVDSGSTWDDEPEAYDESILPGSNAVRTSLPANSWSTYLELTIDAISCSKVRFYAVYGATSINEISIDVYYLGGWHNIYEGAFANIEWVEKAIGSTQTVTAMQVKFYNDADFAANAVLREVDFWKEESATGETGTAVFTSTARDWAAATVIIEALAEAPPEAGANVLFTFSNF